MMHGTIKLNSFLNSFLLVLFSVAAVCSILFLYRPHVHAQAGASVSATVQSDKSVIINGSVGSITTTTVTVRYGTNPNVFTSSQGGVVASDKSFSIHLPVLTDDIYYYVVRDRDDTTLVGTTTQSFTVGNPSGGSFGHGGSDISVSGVTAVPASDGKSAVISGKAVNYTGTSFLLVLCTESGFSEKYTATISSDGSFTATCVKLRPTSDYLYSITDTNNVKLYEGGFRTPSTQIGADQDGDTTVVVTPKDTSAKFEMMLPVGYVYHTAYIEYGTDPKNMKGSIVATDTGAFFVGNIWALRPNTTYYYQVYAADQEETELTKIKTFKTTNGANVGILVAGVVANITAVNITQTSATITGQMIKKGPRVDVVVDLNNNGKFEYKTTPIVNGSGVFTVTIKDLKPAHVYGYMATAVGDATKQYTMPRSFLTPTVNVLPYIESLTDTTAVITAKFSDGVQEPAIRYGIDSDHLSDAVKMKEGEDKKTFTAKLENLKPDTAYVYKLEGYNGGSQVDYTGLIAFLTLVKKETPPAVGTISGGGDTLVTTTYKDEGLIQCGNGRNGGLVQVVDSSKLDINGKPIGIGQQSCGFYQLMQLIQRIIDFLIFLAAPIIATVIILYAGVLILTSGGSTEKVSHAKGMFQKAVIGLLIAMGAWLIVKFVLVTLGYNDTVFAHFY